MKKVTIKDIAKLASVSFKTVSRVINNEPSVKKETREKVEKVLREMNFSVNYNAKRLASNRTKQIGVITNTSNSELSKNYIIMNYLLTYASKKDYTIIVHKDIKEVKRNNLGKFDAGFYEGVIFLNPKDLDIVRKVKEDKIPIIISGISDEFISVGTDQYESGYIATKALIKKKCKNIAMVLGDPETKTNIEKVRGYKKALEDNGYKFSETNIFYNYNKSVDLEGLITKLYLKNEMYDGMLIGTDILGLGAIRAINKLGIKCPSEFKFITFGNTFICNETYPSISSVKQNFEKIAMNLLDGIIDIIETKKEVKSIVIPAEIIERESI